MHTKQQCAGRQQQQWFDFTGVTPEQTIAFQVKVIMPAPQKPKTISRLKDMSPMELRKRLAKTVKAQAMNKRITVRETWGLVFRRLQNATGFNVVSRAIARNQKYVECLQDFGYLQTALDLAAAL